MVKTKYAKARITMTGVPSFYCDGIEIDDETATEDEHAGGQAERISVTHKKRTIKFKLLNPRDAEAAYQVCENCRNGSDYTIVALAKDTKGNWVGMQRLDGCDSPSYKRTIGNFDAVKLEISGTADDTEPLNTTYPLAESATPA